MTLDLVGKQKADSILRIEILRSFSAASRQPRSLEPVLFERQWLYRVFRKDSASLSECFFVHDSRIRHYLPRENGPLRTCMMLRLAVGIRRRHEAL